VIEAEFTAATLAELGGKEAELGGKEEEETYKKMTAR